MLQLEILSPTAKLYEGEVSSIIFPGSLGSFGVLPQHAPLISTLTQGKLEWTTHNKKEYLEIQAGVVEVLKNKVTVLVQ